MECAERLKKAGYISGRIGGSTSATVGPYMLNMAITPLGERLLADRERPGSPRAKARSVWDYGKGPAAFIVGIVKSFPG